MAMLFQYGFGVLPFGDEGFGGYAAAYAEQPYAATDAPVIAFRNELAGAGSSYRVINGEETSAALSHAWNGDLLRGARVTPALYTATRTNLLKWSASRTQWIGGANAVANAALAPDGTMSASRVTRPATGNIVSQSLYLDYPCAGRMFSYSFWLWTDDPNATSFRVYMYTYVQGSVNQEVFFQDFVPTATPTRYSFTRQFTGKSTSRYINVRTDPVVGSSVYVWGDDLKEGELSDYIPTTSAAASRTYTDQTRNVFTFQWRVANTSSPHGFGIQLFGQYGFGGYLPTPREVNCLVLGAARQDSVGARTVPTRYRVWAESGFGTGGFGAGGAGGEVIDYAEAHASNASVWRGFRSVQASRVTVWMWGLPADAVVPELFIGRAVTMPYLDFGFDPQNEVAYGPSFLSEGGREYLQQRYARMEFSPRWAAIDKELWADIDDLRSHAFRPGRPVWFAAMPQSAPDQTYYLRQGDKQTPFPMSSQKARSLSLKLVEAL